ncbi:hypothetical protein [Actinomyces gaoshouyii]|uniref:hypothetical protein n=1 Tax=Actinomyces gaoshouyii TaxID=1960083 RepID=UPI0009C099A6|nr:hypothetical protein [Actinomyces gaoshouyii]ARD41523.1 hypothetical protein B6G06_03395 [Actinomyces gaoshouyii]
MSPEPTDATTSDSKSDPDHSSRRSIRQAEREAEREAILTGQQPLLTRREMKRLREEAEALRAAVAAGEITIEQARALQDPLADEHNITISSSSAASSAEAADRSHDYSASEGAPGVGRVSGSGHPDEPVATPGGGVVAEPAAPEVRATSSAAVDSWQYSSAPPAGRDVSSSGHSAPANEHPSRAAGPRAQEPAAGRDGSPEVAELPWVRAWYASPQVAPPGTSSAAVSGSADSTPRPRGEASEASGSAASAPASHALPRARDGQAGREQQIGSASSLSADQVVEISGFETGVLPSSDLPLAQDGPRSADGGAPSASTSGGPGTGGPDPQSPSAAPLRRSLMERGAQADSPATTQQPTSPQPQRGWQPPQGDRGYEPTWRTAARDGSALGAPQAEASPVPEESNGPASRSGSTTAEPSAPSAIRRPIVRIPAAAQGVRTMNASTGKLGSVQPVDEDFDGIDSPQWRALRSGDEAPLEDEAPAPADTVVTRAPADLRDDPAEDPGYVVPSPYGSYAGYNEPAAPAAPAVAEPQAGRASLGVQPSTDSWEDVTRVGKDSSGSPASRRTLAILLAFVLAAVVLIIIWVIMSQVGGSSVNAEAALDWTPLLT